jgi:hypothetical protein
MPSSLLQKVLLTVVAQKILLTIAQKSWKPCPQLHRKSCSQLHRHPTHNCTGFWAKKERERERECVCGKFKQAALMGRRRGGTPPVERHQGHIPDLTHFLLVLWCDACFESPVTATKQAGSPLVISVFFLCWRDETESLKLFLPSSSTSSSSLPNPKIEEQKRISEKTRDQRSWECDFFKRRVILQNPATLKADRATNFSRRASR